MTTDTITKLNLAATVLADAFLTDCRHGYTTNADVSDIRAKVTAKYGQCNSVEVMKSMIRADKRQIENAFRCLGVSVKFSNILKTPSQLEYVANAVLDMIEPYAIYDEAVNRACKGYIR